MEERRAIHFTTVFVKKFLLALANLRPVPTAKESFMWHTAWCAVIRPHFGVRSGFIRAIRSQQLASAFGSANVLIRTCGNGLHLGRTAFAFALHKVLRSLKVLFEYRQRLGRIGLQIGILQAVRCFFILRNRLLVP